MKSFLLPLVAFLSLLDFHSIAQPAGQKSANDVYVDSKGTMRWGKSKEEVHGFGINYTVPFAHAYRSAKQLNVSHREAIDNDVYHFARLGFDAYRVHVWDTEISDSVGNLLDNEHLQLLDYALKKMKDRGIRFVLTPIAFWGNGWPDPDEKTPGFSRKYGKDACLTDEEAIKAQENYLFQFFNHVNPLTEIAYKSDPDIVAFEISNEPHHHEAPERVTSYINRMMASIRKTGCRKPIFYNISHSIHLVNAYFNAGIQGGTFQWYPTGLVSGKELGGNLLPNVDAYRIPFAANPQFMKGAKIVYEFDAADVGRSYIYPAMARSFREAGIQWATHFAYDATFMAWANTEYNTHYMNLAYAPQKALSLKIASEVFHTIPMYEQHGSYPANRQFGPFRVDYENDLAEMITEKKFFYTNHTKTSVTADKLEEIAGSGNSAVVLYEGTGAYFLDRLEKGVWRLEVMPDAIWIHDPFGSNSLGKEVAVVNWRQWPMAISLPDLGEDFGLKALNDDNSFTSVVKGNSFVIAPGTYMLTKKGVKPVLKPGDRWKNIVLKEFSAPSTTLKRMYVLHEPVTEISAGSNHTVQATIVSTAEPESVELRAWTGFRPKVYPMKKIAGYQYSATIPAEDVKEGFLRYTILLSKGGKFTAYPSGLEGNPADWSFVTGNPYQVNVVPSTSPVFLFNAMTDNNEMSKEWNTGLSVVPTSEPGRAELRVNMEKLFKPDAENPEAEAIHDYSKRYFFGNKVKGRKADLPKKREIVLRGRALNEKPCQLQLALITTQGMAYGGLVKLEAKTGDYVFALSDLKKVKLVTLPRPYPSFLPYFFNNASDGKLDLNDVQSLQISIGPGIPQNELKDRHGVAIETIWLR